MNCPQCYSKMEVKDFYGLEVVGCTKCRYIENT